MHLLIIFECTRRALMKYRLRNEQNRAEDELKAVRRRETFLSFVFKFIIVYLSLQKSIVYIAISVTHKSLRRSFMNEVSFHEKQIIVDTLYFALLKSFKLPIAGF
jgi:hypothetical protein